MHRKGTYIIKIGCVYVGDFVEDKFKGKGTMTYATGNKYEGDFLDDKMHG